MSEESIRRKLAKAYAKAGKVLGRAFDVYRPLTLNDAFSAQNLIQNKKPAAFTLNKDFVSPITEGFSAYTVYTDHLNVNPGDIFFDDKETFVILWNRAIEDVIAIKATNLIEVHRPTWDTVNGLQAVKARIARNVPASLTGITSGTDNRLSKVDATGQGIRWEVRIWATAEDIKQTDNIVLENGRILRVDSVKITELSQVLTCSEVA